MRGGTLRRILEIASGAQGLWRGRQKTASTASATLQRGAKSYWAAERKPAQGGLSGLLGTHAGLHCSVSALTVVAWPFIQPLRHVRIWLGSRGVHSSRCPPGRRPQRCGAPSRYAEKRQRVTRCRVRWALWAAGFWPTLSKSNRGYPPADWSRSADVGVVGLLMRRLGGTLGLHRPDGACRPRCGLPRRGRRKPSDGGRAAPGVLAGPAPSALRSSAVPPWKRVVGDSQNLCCPVTRAVVPTRSVHDGYLVDSASSHMLVLKIKPCMSKYKQLYSETANGSLNQLSFIW